MRLRPEQLGEQARDDRSGLIAAAWTVLERAGFEDFKVQLLLRETGLSARTFYEHFADKDELFAALMLDEYSRSARRAEAAVAGATTPADQVMAWIREIILAASEPKRMARARLFTSHPTVVRRYADRLDAGVQLLREPLERVIRRGHDDGLFPWAVPDRDAALILQLSSSAMIDALAEGSHPPVEEIVDRVTQFVLRALGLPQT